MDETARERAIQLAEALLTGEGDDEAIGAAVRELEQLVPDPRVSDLIFWPSHHERSAGLDPAELTAEKIVDLASEYRPFAL